MTLDEIAKLPTLKDVVNHYIAGERKIENRVRNTIFEAVFPTCALKGLYQPVLMHDGKHILLPLSPAQHSYYRGESDNHAECYPSLYRKGMSEADIFVERVKRCEMERMMQEYPITDLFANSIHAKAPDGAWHKLRFRIGFDGMAQHYGIKTEFMDMTLDPWIAAFFAATEYDFSNDTYTAITDTTKHPYGTFYLYNEIPIPFRNSERIDVVGMQPLLRPGRQQAFVFRMQPEENFNSLVSKTYFRHDASINKEIVSRFNVENNLFPKELLGERIRSEIVKGDEFSMGAYNEARHRYAQGKSDAELKSYMKKGHIRINTNNRSWFTDVEKKQAVDYWEIYKQELFSKIRLRWTYIESTDLLNEDR